MKKYLVQVMTQLAPGYRTAREWRHFNRYTAKSKADAVKQAREEARQNDCFGARDYGLVWFRAECETWH